MGDAGPAKNTDRELYREPDTTGCGDFYSDSIHVTEAGGIGIDCGGHVIVKPLRDWHALAKKELPSPYLQPQPQADGWSSDMDAAPKDGRAILLLSAGQTVCVGEPEETYHPPRCAIGCWNAEGTSWVDEFGQIGSDTYDLAVTGVWFSGGGWFQPNEVTHWQPLPSPPGEAPRGWKCAASVSIGANDPQECDWPTCGCDPYADKVIAVLQEVGFSAPGEPPSQTDGTRDALESVKALADGALLNALGLTPGSTQAVLGKISATASQTLTLINKEG